MSRHAALYHKMEQSAAVALAESGVWREWSDEEIVKFQLFEDRLCMEFPRFHEAVEKVLGRPVFTHEFAYRDGLVDEYLGLRPAPTLDEILDLIPADKRIIVMGGGQ